MDIDKFIEHTKEKAREHRYHADFFGNDNPMYTACIKSAEDCEQLAEWLTKLKEYQQLEEQCRLIKLPVKNDMTECRECIHTKSQCHHENCKCSECPLTELFCDEFYKAIDRCYEDAYASGCLAGIELGKSEVEAKLKELRGGENESCCKCDSRKTDTDMVKVNSLEIIVRTIENKPYYEVKYKEVGRDDYCIGYSSYDSNIVLAFVDKYFKIVENDKQTNADKIRDMSDEELAELITGGLNFDCTDYCENFSNGCAFNCNGKDRELALRWLQTEAE